MIAHPNEMPPRPERNGRWFVLTVDASDAERRSNRNTMRRALTIGAATVSALALSATVVVAGGGVSGVAKGHGQAVSEVAAAADAVSGKAHGEAISAIARQHGALVSAAAKAQGQANAAAGQANGKGAEKSAEGRAKGDEARESSRLKD
jgi:hypothetical protein